MQLTSYAFNPNGLIPQPYTCQGEDLSPPLEWHGVPEGTQSLVLIVDDPDTQKGTHTHWVVYNIPANQNRLPCGIGGDMSARGIAQGMNDSGKIGYGGPCPPRLDAAHRYFFRLYALDMTLDLAPGAARADVEDAMQGHILVQVELMGVFES